ncbi:MAG: hypothetical protein JXM70_16680 [Pirellulales bacterium]|nr:hypothetical protein [Pirellulales bacterium]
MSVKPETTDKSKKAIQVLRERRGGVPRELTDRNKQQDTIRKNITAALDEGSKTVPEISKQLELPMHEVFWYVMGLKKYGKVVEAEQVDGYFKYALVDNSQQVESKS